MTPLAAAAIIAQCAATGVSLRAARVRPEVKPVRNFLLAMSAALLIRWAGLTWIIEPFQAAHPGEVLVGLARAAGAVEASLFIGWYFALAALALTVFRGSSWKPVALVWALASIALAIAYPWSRGANLARVYAAAELVALATGAGTGIEWAWKRERPGPHHASVITLLLLEVAVLMGPMRLGIFSGWDRAQVAYIAAYVAVTCIVWGASWKRESPSS